MKLLLLVVVLGTAYAQDCDHEGSAMCVCNDPTTYMLPDRSECRKCNLAIPNCITCKDWYGVKIYAETCEPGYYVDGTGNCKQYDANCNKVNPTGKCTGCADNFFLDSKTNKCTACDASCSACKDTTSCSKCKDNFVASTDPLVKTCVACPAGCSKCSSTTACTGCIAGWYLDGTTCKTCISLNAALGPFCDECAAATPNTCSKCRRDVTNNIYYQPKATTGNTCDKCADANCVACSADVNTCTQCSGSYQVSGGKCVLCDSQCTDCKTSGANKCDAGKCNTGFMRDATDQTCKACADDCDACTVPGECSSTSCKTGFLYDATGKNCVACAKGCTECPTNLAGKCDTGKCSSGFVEDTTNNVCDACGPQCLVCTTKGKGSCDDAAAGNCNPGFGVDNTDSTCKSCDPNCKECNVNGAGKCDTASCNTGYSLVGSNCALCDPNCKAGCATEGAGKCDATCNSGWIIDATAKVCDKCADFCTECSTKAQCDAGKCEPGYMSDANICAACAANCDSCTVVGECSPTGCKKGYGKTATKTCGKCADNCDECPTNGEKLCDSGKCKTGFIYFTQANEALDKTCLACPDNCNECDFDGTSTTTPKARVCKTGKCKTTFGLKDGKCLPCPFGCDKCTWTTDRFICDTCTATFGVNSQLCGKCPDNCMDCEDGATGSSPVAQMNCKACRPGFGLTPQNTCQSCSKSNCGVCGANYQVCEKCTAAANFDENENCVLCSDNTFTIDNCATCGRRDPGTAASIKVPCLTCADTYYLKNNRTFGLGALCVQRDFACLNGLYIDCPDSSATAWGASLLLVFVAILLHKF